MALSTSEIKAKLDAPIAGFIAASARSEAEGVESLLRFVRHIQDETDRSLDAAFIIALYNVAIVNGSRMGPSFREEFPSQYRAIMAAKESLGLNGYNSLTARLG